MDENVNMSRRTMLGGMALGASVLFAGGLGCKLSSAVAYANAAEGNDAQAEEYIEEQYGFLMNVARCINCGKCVEACRLWSRTPESLPARRKITSYRDAAGREVHVSTSCMHCANPACAKVCPAGAIKKGSGGIVTVDKELCIGCKYCFQACPFEAPHYDSKSMDKCDYCLGADVKLGEAPHCVQACKVQALRFGKLDDLIALSDRTRKVEGSTDPSCVLV